MPKAKSAERLQHEWARFLVCKHLIDIHVAFPDLARAKEYHRVLGEAINWQYQQGRSRAVDWNAPVARLVIDNDKKPRRKARKR